MSSTQKTVNLALLFFGVIVFLFLHQLTAFVWDAARLPVMNGWPLGPDAVISFGATLVIFFFVRWNTKINRFLNEVVSELLKVVWPEGKETVMSTGVVIVMVAISSVILFVMDKIWGTLSARILNL
jgi:preprotein translocase subunit SecE